MATHLNSWLLKYPVNACEQSIRPPTLPHVPDSALSQTMAQGSVPLQMGDGDDDELLTGMNRLGMDGSWVWDFWWNI